MQFDNQSLNAYLALAAVDPDSSADDDVDPAEGDNRAKGDVEATVRTSAGKGSRSAHQTVDGNAEDGDGGRGGDEDGEEAAAGEEEEEEEKVAVDLRGACAVEIPKPRPKQWATSTIVGISIVVVLVLVAVVWTYRTHTMPSVSPQAKKPKLGSRRTPHKDVGQKKGAERTPKTRSPFADRDDGEAENVEGAKTDDGSKGRAQRTRTGLLGPKVHTKKKKTPVNAQAATENRKVGGDGAQPKNASEPTDEEAAAESGVREALCGTAKPSRSPFLESSPPPVSSRQPPPSPAQHHTSRPGVGCAHRQSSPLVRDAQPAAASHEEKHNDPDSHQYGKRNAPSGAIASAGADGASADEDDEVEIPDDETIAGLSKEDLAHQIKAMYMYDADMRQRYRTLRTLHVQLLSQTQVRSLEGVESVPLPGGGGKGGGGGGSEANAREGDRKDAIAVLRDTRTAPVATDAVHGLAPSAAPAPSDLHLGRASPRPTPEYISGAAFSSPILASALPPRPLVSEDVVPTSDVTPTRSEETASAGASRVVPTHSTSTLPGPSQPVVGGLASLSSRTPSSNEDARRQAAAVPASTVPGPGQHTRGTRGDGKPVPDNSDTKRATAHIDREHKEPGGRPPPVQFEEACYVGAGINGDGGDPRDPSDGKATSSSDAILIEVVDSDGDADDVVNRDDRNPEREEEDGVANDPSEYTDASEDDSDDDANEDAHADESPQARTARYRRLILLAKRVR